jgi:hypothetical protein
MHSNTFLEHPPSTSLSTEYNTAVGKLDPHGTHILGWRWMINKYEEKCKGDWKKNFKKGRARE